MKKAWCCLMAMGLSLCSFGQAVSQLKGDYRDGQVFLTWAESGLQADTELSVYSHSQAITKQNLTSATLLATHIQPGSARDWWRDYASFAYQGEIKHDPPVGFVIKPGAAELNPASGLFVHTVTKATAGKRYYAVVWTTKEAAEPQVTLGANSLTEPIEGAVSQPVAIWQGEAAKAPKRGDGRGKLLMFSLHGRGGGMTAGPRPSEANMLWFADARQGWREGLPFKFKLYNQGDRVVITPHDRVWVNRKVLESPDSRDFCPAISTFWIGYNTEIYRTLKTPEIVVQNYTEEYLLGLMDWAQNWLGTDPNRVYFQGGSMGGSGSVSMALHYPNRIAAIMADVPVYSYTWEKCKTSNAITANRLVCFCGPLKTSPSRMVDGSSLFEYLDGTRYIGQSSQDMPPIFAYNGRKDASIPWVNNPPFYTAANKGRQAFAVFWNDGDHGMGRTVPEDAKKWYSQYLKYRLDCSYPAFSNCSDNKNYGNGEPDNGDIIGWINRGFDWNVVKDTAESYAITLSATHPEITYPVTADVTIRRRQQFRPAVGQTVTVTVNGQKQTVTIGNDGLLTIPRVTFADAKPVTLECTK